jgi:Flp pilus assembly protein TadG
MELLFVLPVLLVLLLAMIQLSLLLVTEQQLQTASREGARVAAVGGDQSAVEMVVRRTLGSGRLQAAQVQAFLTDDTGQPLAAGDPVVVVVALRAGAAVPDLMPFLGLSTGQQLLVGRTVLSKE